MDVALATALAFALALTFALDVALDVVVYVAVDVHWMSHWLCLKNVYWPNQPDSAQKMSCSWRKYALAVLFSVVLRNFKEYS